jgi:hypothetical protein
MGIYAADIQKLYVAYFNRPADVGGMAYWEPIVTTAKDPAAALAAIAAAFSQSAEYKATYANMDSFHIIDRVYQNLFGRAAEKEGLLYWANVLNNKQMTIDNIVTTIAKGAQDNGATGGFNDKTALEAKIAAAGKFTDNLDTSAEILGYSGDAANAQAKLWLSTVTDAASLQAAISQAALDAAIVKVITPAPTPLTFNLTAGLDTIPGGAGNDTINATTSAGANALTIFDNVDGGAGTDSINFTDITTAAGGQFAASNGSVKNVEIVNVATTGGVNLNTKAWTGVTNVNVTAAGTGAAAVNVADGTTVVLSSATTGLTSVTGGKVVTVALSDATAGNVGVTGAALTNVTVKGGAVATVDNVDADAVSGKGATLTNVTLDGVTGASASLKGAALTNVSLKNIVQDSAITVTNATASHGLNVSLDGVGYAANGTTAVAVTVADAIATSLTLHANTKSNLGVDAVKATKVTVDGSAALVLDLNGATNTAVKTIDASAATGALTLNELATATTSVTTGSGNDTFTLNSITVKDNAATTDVDETVNATVSTGAGKDSVTLTVGGTGKVTVDTGAGDDSLNVLSRSGNESLSISLGDGNDTFTAAVGVSINATDVVDAGAGTDILSLNLVGSANIGAFSGFDVFDAANLAKTLDVDILATKNTVSEIIASGDVGAGAALLNVGAGVGVRVTGDMAASTLALTQKTGGALTVTVDADETGTATDAADTRVASVNATNATSIKAVFGTSYLTSTKNEVTAGDNVTTLKLASATATSLTIDSSGALSNNVLTYNDSAAKLASVTVTGAQALNLAITNSKAGTVDSSAATGGLTFSTDSLTNGGKVVLGSGVDTITVTAGSTATNFESVQGIEKSGAIVVSTAAADATAKAAAIADADTLVFGAGNITAADANAGVTTGTIAKGVLTFTGAGPATLADAISIANAAADADGEAVVFQYLGDSYAFVQGAAVSDIVVKLVGVTSVTQFAEITADHFTLI